MYINTEKSNSSSYCFFPLKRLIPLAQNCFTIQVFHSSFQAQFNSCPTRDSCICQPLEVSSHRVLSIFPNFLTTPPHLKISTSVHISFLDLRYIKRTCQFRTLFICPEYTDGQWFLAKILNIFSRRL